MRNLVVKCWPSLAVPATDSGNLNHSAHHISQWGFAAYVMTLHYLSSSLLMICRYGKNCLRFVISATDFPFSDKAPVGHT
jgi:hypothetical protein